LFKVHGQFRSNFSCPITVRVLLALSDAKMEPLLLTHPDLLVPQTAANEVQVEGEKKQRC
jgi:hypothetical protein